MEAIKIEAMVAAEGFEPPTSAYETDKLPLLYAAITSLWESNPSASINLPGVSEDGSHDSLWWLNMESDHMIFPYEGNGQPLPNLAMWGELPVTLW